MALFFKNPLKSDQFENRILCEKIKQYRARIFRVFFESRRKRYKTLVKIRDIDQKLYDKQVETIQQEEKKSMLFLSRQKELKEYKNSANSKQDSMELKRIPH